ncbi:MAG: helix-hairpin-helix domain-containing protein [Maribacter sp.]|nr:helix-hairpin-helix domain-containing protein [Maribacter sp.]
MNKFKSHFSFSKQERSGIFFLLLIIVVLQVLFFILKYTSQTVEGNVSVDKDTQVKIDELKAKSNQKDSLAMFPFNPNFISDFKGYTLGMSVEEIDRLHAFRAKNEFVNNADEFQKITQVSDSLLLLISPYFKFPEWTKTNSKRRSKSAITSSQEEKLDAFGEAYQIKDLNSATAEDLKVIRGIGDILSQRIVKFRNRLGGFIVDDQLFDVYGLEPEVVERTFERFKVLSQPQINKININKASAEEISKLIYLSYDVAADIVAYRKINGSITSFGELTKIEDFPKDKIHRIELYLSL